MKLKKIISIILCACTLSIVLCSCGEDVQRVTYTDEKDIAIEAEATSIASLEPEITAIAQEYDEDCVLVEAFATYKAEQIALQEGTISFSFTSEVKDKARVTVVVVKYDMQSQKVVSVTFDEGNGAFVDSATDPIEETVKQVLFKGLFEQMKNDASMNSKLSGANVTLTIEFTQKIECKVL